MTERSGESMTDLALHAALQAQLLAWGDDELVLGHRDSEWCGAAPIVEEDIAFANLALDELGHAALWYGLLAEVSGQDPEKYPDELVYRRPAEAFRCAQLVELPRGDWAFAILRQFLFDAAEAARLDALAESTFPSLAGAAQKVRKEERYHMRHSQAWTRRLGLGTDESHARMQGALEAAWPYTAQLFRPLEGEEQLTAAGVLPEASARRQAWEMIVLPTLAECDLRPPHGRDIDAGRETHTPHLKLLVADLQSVAQLDPSAEW